MVWCIAMLRGWWTAARLPLLALLLVLQARAGQGSHGAAPGGAGGASGGGGGGLPLRVAAVTGGASGIGYALAKKCLRSGVHVVLICIFAAHALLHTHTHTHTHTPHAHTRTTNNPASHHSISRQRLMDTGTTPYR
jgi:uncharacterized membrane protein